MNSDESDPHDFDETPKDILHRSIKAGLGAFPVVGTAFAEIFAYKVQAPVEKRKLKFMLALAERLEKLEQKNLIDINSLKTNDEFLDILIQSFDSAAKYSQDEKIKALQNVVLNSALKIDISRDEKSMFLNIVNDLTPVDMMALKIWYAPESALTEIILDRYEQEPDGVTVPNVTIPDDFGLYLHIDSNFFDIILNNLETRGLLQNTKGKHSSGLPPHGDVENIVKNMASATNERTTSFGRRFLQFISDPKV